MSTFGTRLSSARHAAGITQLQLAVKVGCDPTTVSRAERDEVNPSAELVSKFAAALSVSTDSLLLDQKPSRRASA